MENLKEFSTSGMRLTTAAKIVEMGSPVGPGRSSGMAGVVTITVMTVFTPFMKSSTVSGEAAACVVSSHPPIWIARKALTREACVAGDIARPET
jgi:predicted anti-sigma-YlaC factor YlaD